MWVRERESMCVREKVLIWCGEGVGFLFVLWMKNRWNRIEGNKKFEKYSFLPRSYVPHWKILVLIDREIFLLTLKKLGRRQGSCRRSVVARSLLDLDLNFFKWSNWSIYLLDQIYLLFPLLLFFYYFFARNFNLKFMFFPYSNFRRSDLKFTTKIVTFINKHCLIFK